HRHRVRTRIHRPVSSTKHRQVHPAWGGRATTATRRSGSLVVEVATWVLSQVYASTPGRTSSPSDWTCSSVRLVGGCGYQRIWPGLVVASTTLTLPGGSSTCTARC